MVGISYDNIPFPESDLNSTTSNRSLGRFFTAWGQVEVVYGRIFRDLSQMEYDIGSIVFEKIGVREQLDILEDFAELIEDDTVKASLASSLAAIRAISVARNKLAHSRWGRIGHEAARFWVGLTHAHIEDIFRERPKGPTWRKRFIFTVAEINALTSECVRERDNLIDLLWTLTNKRFEPKPEGDAHYMARRDRRHPALKER